MFADKTTEEVLSMRIEKTVENNIEVAHIVANDVVISDLQSAVDLMMTVKYDAGIKNIAISKNLIADNFFILSSGLAGAILQKFIDYRFRIAIYGDYSKYTSKPLKDFIYESNNGHDIFFVDSLQSAVKYLTEK